MLVQISPFHRIIILKLKGEEGSINHILATICRTRALAERAVQDFEMKLHKRKVWRPGVHVHDS